MKEDAPPAVSINTYQNNTELFLKIQHFFLDLIRNYAILYLYYISLPGATVSIIYTLQKKSNYTIAILFFLSITSFIFAQEKSLDTLSELQKQARAYRNQGFGLQRIGDLEGAMSLYQKAIELDPAYAVAYNDLGIIYEAKGDLEKAEQNYLKAITVDPDYLSAYSNLALLYENKRELNKAILYWEKRAELGSDDDPWTEKARQRLNDIHLVQEGLRFNLDSREQEVIDLVKDVLDEKSVLREDDTAQAKKYFEKARQSYNRQDYATARKEALDAQALDPANKEIEKFIEEVQRKALSR